ncbi:hypothetical protein D3C87_1506690 [compost metagenome]
MADQLLEWFGAERDCARIGRARIIDNQCDRIGRRAVYCKGGVCKALFVCVEQKADFALLENRDFLGAMNRSLSEA